MSARETILTMLRSTRALRLVVWAWRLAMFGPALRALWSSGARLVDGHYWQAAGWLTLAAILGAIGAVIIRVAFQDLQQMADRRMYVIDCDSGNVTRLPRRR